MPRKFDPETIYAPIGQDYNAIEVGAGERLVFSSGIIGMTKDGTLLEDATAQIDQAWMNVAHFLDGMGMTTDNLVRLKMHLTDRDLLPVSRDARIRHLGEHMHCAVTGVIVELFDQALLIEINVVAAA